MFRKVFVITAPLLRVDTPPLFSTSQLLCCVWLNRHEFVSILSVFFSPNPCDYLLLDPNASNARPLQNNPQIKQSSNPIGCYCLFSCIISIYIFTPPNLPNNLESLLQLRVPKTENYEGIKAVRNRVNLLAHIYFSSNTNSI